MPSIAETIERLSKARARQTHGSTAPTHAARLYEIANFGPNPGKLACRAYMPPNLPAGAPLVVVLHGCTQSAEGYDHGSGWSRLADEAGFALLFPEQTGSNNANHCFNWFVQTDIARGSGEAASIRSMIEHLLVVHELDRSRLFVTGLSAGGAMAAAMAATYPELFAGAAVIGGLPYGSAIGVNQALERMRGAGGAAAADLAARVRAASPHSGPWPRIAIWHGDADHVVAAANAEDSIGQWAAVQGIDLGHVETRRDGRDMHRLWRAADGSIALEYHCISGMGHGTPISRADPAGGEAGPYMLDVGIASNRAIASTWGIAEAKAAAQPGVTRPSSTTAAATAAAPPGRQSGPHAWPPTQPAGGPADSRKSGIARTIEDALRSAGLMQ